ncbi:hypothetical protein ACP4OV_021608 [Aristida adscensionis]
MVNADSAGNVVGIIGNFIAFGLFLSPVPTFVRIVKKRDVQEFAPDPYLATFLNCALWVLYGLPFVHPNSILVLTINAAGLAIEAVYLSIYFAYASRPRCMLTVLAAELVLLAAVAASVLLAARADERSLVVGSLCVVFGTLMYAAPLTIMSRSHSRNVVGFRRQVITTRSVEYMPFTVSLVSFLNGICWTTYALIRSDIFVMIPNGIGTLLSTAQLILYFCYYKATPNNGGKDVELLIMANGTKDGAAF